MRALFAVLFALATGNFISSDAWAAGAAYVVDTADVPEAGACKVESWISSASNHDFSSSLAPGCGVSFFRPSEASIQLNRARSDGAWTTAASPKLKTNLVPSGIGTWGVGIAASASFDFISRENTSVAAYVPVTLRLSENARINLNGGWQWDRTVDRHYLTYGAGVDIRTPDNVWTLTGEVFGLSGVADVSTIIQPRFQLGVRYRPVDQLSFDVIYGRNITGENANWITFATTVRFPTLSK